MKELPIIIKQPIKHIDLVRYSGASGDFNEIHTIPSVAKESGMPTVIVHGMLLMGWCTEAIYEWFPHRIINNIKVRFQAIVIPGTEILIKGIWQKTGNNQGEIELIDSKGEMKLKGFFELK